MINEGLWFGPVYQTFVILLHHFHVCMAGCYGSLEGVAGVVTGFCVVAVWIYLVGGYNGCGREGNWSLSGKKWI